MRDLMIGHRRTGQPRPGRAAVIGLGLLAAAGVVTWFIFERSVTYEPPHGEASGTIRWSFPAGPTGPTGEPGALVYRDTQLRWNGGIAVLRLRGDAHAMGVAHGRLLSDSLASRDVATGVFDGLSRGRGSWARMTHRLRIDWRLRFLDDGLQDTDRAMVAGMMRGADLPDDRYQQLVRLQAVWDLGSAALSNQAGGLCRTLSVVGLQSGTTAGRVWIGHQFAAPGLDDGGESLVPLVVFAHPQGALPWAALGWPSGAGVATGINSKGIAVMVNPARTRDVRATRSARPILLLARSVLEHATTLDEAIRTLASTSTLGSATYLVVDGRAGKWAIVERSPSRAVVTRSTSSLAIGDFLTSSVFAADPENDRSHRMSPSASRVARAQQLLRVPMTSVEQMAALLRDQRTSDEIARPLGHRGVPFDPSAQIAIVDPSLMVLWVADPSAAGRLRAFDLRHELEAVGDRPAPPSDIPPDPSMEAASILQVQSARRDLRLARKAFGSGRMMQARQLADRAVARSPALPEALELAGELASTTGDRTAARALWQRWLDGGADDPGLEAKVRARLATNNSW
jgi:Acyl-coenzyme A:6-aminopenicillanic acid acyl-transferase